MSIPLVLHSKKLESFTEEEFYQFCIDNSDLRIERNEKGQIIIMSPVGIDSVEMETEIAYQLSFWNKKSKKGRAYGANAGFTLPDNSVRSPDAAWISSEKIAQLPPADRKRFGHICPDFIVELVSESDSVQSQKEKMQMWMRNGVRLGWLIDPKKEEVFIYREGGAVEIIKGFDHKLSGEQVLPEFEFILAELRINE